MPETYLTVKWPDEEVHEVYSPSTIVTRYFEVGDEMSVDEFMQKSSDALKHASKRVEDKYGYACSAAMASLQEVLHKGKMVVVGDDSKTVKILAIH